MRESEFIRGIQQAFNYIVEIKLAGWENLSKYSNLKVNKEFNRIALNKKSKYEEIYKFGLCSTYYNFTFIDLSYFQFSYRKVNSSDFLLRYAYYPNPFDESLLYDQPGSAEEFETKFDDSELVITKPPIRYDYVSSSYVEAKHPISHLHIGHQNTSRCPIRKILSPEAFVLFVCKNFYNSNWSIKDCDENPTTSGYKNEFDQYFADIKNNCSDLEECYFSVLDEKHFYIA